MNIKWVRLSVGLLVVLSLLSLWSCEKLSDVLGGLSKEEIVKGLKTALDTASRDATGIASSVGGFYQDEIIKILLPKEVTQAREALGRMNSSNILIQGAINQGKRILDEKTEQIIFKFNRAAEEASKRAYPEFKRAIRNMSIVDGLKILQGGDTAATLFLRHTTNDALDSAFRPIVLQAVNTIGGVEEYQALARKYNAWIGTAKGLAKLDPDLEDLLSSLPDSVTPDVTDHVTRGALSGIYTLMGREERKIREDPQGYASDIIRKVFGSGEAKAGRVSAGE